MHREVDSAQRLRDGPVPVPLEVDGQAAHGDREGFARHQPILIFGLSRL